MKKNGWMRLGVVLMTLLMLMSLSACKKNDGVVENGDIPTLAADESGLTELLDSIARLPVATMGVGIQASTVAYQTMNWCKDTTLTSGDITQIVSEYTAAMSGDEADMFIEQLGLVSGYCEQLYNEETREAVLVNIGIENGDFGWTDASYEKAVTLTSY